MKRQFLRRENNTMKEQQILNLDECKELGKLELSKEVVVTLLAMGTLALFKRGQGVSNTLPFKGRGCTNPLEGHSRKQGNL